MMEDFNLLHLILHRAQAEAPFQAHSGRVSHFRTCCVTRPSFLTPFWVEMLGRLVGAVRGESSGD